VSKWATPSDIARFAIQLMDTYRGDGDDLISQAMASEMLTPQINERGLGPLIYDEGGDRIYFMHPGANDGYRSVLKAYPERRQGVVIMTNSDSGDLLYREILNSVSIEYAWFRDNTGLYAGLPAVLIFALLGTRFRRRHTARVRRENQSRNI
jgi:CubicO group peptidase (beta-lactamase class C family)